MEKKGEIYQVEQALLNKYIGNKIKEFRKKKSLTQEELGKKIGVKHSTISSYERGLIDLSLTTLFTLAEIFEIKVDELFPPRENTTDHFDLTKGMYTKDLSSKEMKQLQQIFDKAASMNDEEREQYIKGLLFASEYHDKMSQNN